MTIGVPAATVWRNASSSITPSWNHGDGLVGELTGRRRAPEHVDHVDRERDVGQRRVPLLAQHRLGQRVDGHDALALALEQLGDAVRRPPRVVEADHRPRLALVEHQVHPLLPLPVAHARNLRLSP